MVPGRRFKYTSCIYLVFVPQWAFFGSFPLSTHCGLLLSYGNIDPRRYWPRYWFVAWWHQAIISTNIDSSLMRIGATHLRAISRRVPKLPFGLMKLQIIFLKLLPHPPGLNELTHWPWTKWLRFPYAFPWKKGLYFYLKKKGWSLFRRVQLISQPWFELYPVNMPERALTGPEPGRCYRHRPGSGPVMAGHGMFAG